MAAAASSSSSNPHNSSAYSGKWEYDVFLCFRGADTRRGFTSHLKAALSDKQIKVFIDDMLEKTESIDELIAVLRRSALSVVIFSENFADSSWCLDEVATISQRMVEFGHRVLPVFYEVKTSDVSEDSGSYAAVIEQKHGASKSPEDRKRWTDALKAVANCAGHTSQAIKIDSELVKVVVKDVLKTLLGMSSRVIMSNNLVGMDARIFEVEQLLAMDVDDFRIIGLCGMGGVGKTTLAKAVYQRSVSSEKEIKHHFIQDISEKLQKQSGIDGMVHELYSILLSEDDLRHQNLDISYRRDRLSRLRVFVVLDNVETILQFEQLLLGDTIFGSGSRIILTTRDRRVLESAGARVYDVNCLDTHDSLQLFAIHAFRQSVPPYGWSGLSDEVVSYCKGNPLAIKVLGGSLFNREKSYWNSFLCELGKIPNPEIHNVLRRSYDMLETLQKEVFLDIACFFTSIVPKSLLVAYFSTNSRVDHVIEDLIDKSLLSCVLFDNNFEVIEIVEVHDLLREMAWSIVNEEPKLGNRTRLKNFDEIQQLLTIQNARRFNFFNIMKVKEKHKIVLEGGRATEGIILDLSVVGKTMHLETNAFEGMTSFRYLSFKYSKDDCRALKVRVPYGGLDSLPDCLRWLVWDGFPSKYISSRFSPENLVVLRMPHSLALKRCWKVQPKLVNLVLLDLSHCIKLVAVPDLSMSSNLEFLILKGCKSLIELPSHVQDLDKLIWLDLDDCSTLQSLPPKLNSKFLKYFRLSNCPKVTRCPEINSRELLLLNLEETPIAHLPNAIHNLKQGGTLLLCGKHITSFPAVSASLKGFRLCHTTIREMDCYDDDDHQQQGSMPTFVQVELVGNPQLKSLSRNIWRMISQTLVLEDSPLIKSLPEILQPVNDLTTLSITGCRNLKSFPAGIDNLKSLQDLRFIDTDIRSLPACILELHQLSILVLRSNKSLELVPNNIHKLAKLSYFILRGCSRIQSLPELPPNLLTLEVSACTSLQTLPSNIAKLRLKHLCFEDCPQLDMNLPKEIVHNFPNHATSNLHPQGFLQYSGYEIPEWFAYKNLNCENDSCMMEQLPFPNSTKQLIKGIAFGVVCSPKIGFAKMSATCDCNTDTATAASWSSPIFCLGLPQSDYVYIWYEKNLLGETKQVTQEEAKPWYERYVGRTVSFRFSLQPHKKEDLNRVKSIKIKSIGVSLLY